MRPSIPEGLRFQYHSGLRYSGYLGRIAVPYLGGTDVTDYRALSMWHDTAGSDLTPRAPLGGPVDVDVAIVGAGYTGLWTAYYLKKADPSLRIALFEREIAGFGASGRNGGWCSQLFATPREKLAKTAGRGSAQAMQRAMFDTVREVGRAVEEEDIACDFHQGGNLVFASNRAQLETVRQALLYERDWGFGEDDYRLLAADEAAERLAVSGSLGALYSPHCARVHPAKLVRGLADVVEKLGVPIYEQTPVLSIGERALTTQVGVVRADVVVRATECYTVQLPGLERTLVPIYSLMMCTEPLPVHVWDEIGWQDQECVTDGRHLIVYACRTADDRIAIGGRGAPYQYGSRIDPRFETDDRVRAILTRTLRGLFPALGDPVITHTWGGPVALPRDWSSSVGYDPDKGLAWAGGYIGDGVSTTNLAGRTLCDLIRGEETDLTRMPWVNHAWRDWEPEPFRWLGVNLSLKMMESADRAEARSGRPARRVAVTEYLVGR